MVNNVSQQLGCIHQTWTFLCSIINYSSCPLPHCILNIYLISYLFQKVGCRGYDPSARKTLKICKTKKIQSPNNPSESAPPKICKTKKIQSRNNPFESEPPKICKTKKIRSPYDPSECGPPKICKTKKIQSPNNPSKSKSPKICKTKKIQSPNNPSESKPPKICQTKKIQSPNNPFESNPPTICKTKKIQSPNNPPESKPPKICKTKKIQSPNNPSESKPPKICKTKKIQSPNNPSKSKSPKICKTKKIQSPNNPPESKPPKICQTKKIQSPNNPFESNPPKICKTKKIQSPNNPSESKPPKICKTKNIQSPNNPSESEPPNICQTKRTQSPNSPSQSKQYTSSKSVKLNNFLIIVKEPYSSFDTWQRICRINSVDSRCDVSKNPDQSFKASFYLNNVWVCDGTGKYEKTTKCLGAKKTLVYFAKNLNIFVVDTTKVPEANLYSIDANYFVAIEKCDLKPIFRFHINSFIDNHKMVKLELRNINACSHPLVENHFNEVASCFKLIKELQSKKERKTHRKSWFYKENSVTHKMDDFLLQYLTK